MTDAQSEFARERREEEQAIMPAQTCIECGQLTLNYYRIDPRTGSVLRQGVVGRDCYERIVAQVARERMGREEPHQ